MRESYDVDSAVKGNTMIVHLAVPIKSKVCGYQVMVKPLQLFIDAF